MTQAEEPRLERVVVLEGGISSEREVSLLSGRGVKEALASKGLEVESWDPAVDSVGGLEEGAYDAAFIALHGTLGEDGSVQGTPQLHRSSLYRSWRDGFGDCDG